MELNKLSITVRGIILHDDKFLLVKMPHNNFYCLPGGKLDFNEGIEECLERELVEELGIKPKIGRLLYVNNFILKGTEQCLDFIFEVKNGKDYLDLENVNRTHAFELSEICWKSRDEDIKFLPEKIFNDFKEGKVLSDEVRFI